MSFRLLTTALAFAVTLAAVEWLDFGLNRHFSKHVFRLSSTLASPLKVGEVSSDWREEDRLESRYEARPYAGILSSGIIGPIQNGIRRVLLKSSKTGRTIYDATYTIDSNRRRVTPNRDTSKKKLHAIFLGGSLTYGEGSNDDQTIPYYFAQDRKEFRSYNLAFHGYGINDLLARARDPGDGSWDGIRESDGVALYLHIKDHIRRLYGAMRYQAATGWSPHAYFAQGPDGVPAFRGTFESGRPWLNSIYRFLAPREFVKFFNIDLPPAYTPEDWAFFTRAVLALKEEYLRRFPRGHFIVVLLPFDGKGDSRFISCLDAAGIQYLDYSEHDVDEFLKEPGHFSMDPHFTPAANRWIAQQISEDASAFLQSQKLARSAVK